MLFITNRAAKNGKHQNINTPYEFDLDDNAPSNVIHCCERSEPNQYMEIGSDALLSRLKQSQAQQLLFYIHGFSNLPEPDIFPRAQKLQIYFNEREQNLVEVIPLIWPCDNDFGIIKDYWDDQKSADMSGISFSRLLQLFMAWRHQTSVDTPCLKRMNILAHSMGNRVFRETLQVWNKNDLASGVPLLFRNSLLVAADIVNESLEKGKPGDLITQISKNVVVYYASDDLALRSSKISNVKNLVASRRLGHTGPEDMNAVSSNVYAIDCDDFNNSYDFPTGHSYFLGDQQDKAGKVFEHIFKTIKTGRVPVVDLQSRTQIL